jgi:hypothetical protein
MPGPDVLGGAFALAGLLVPVGVLWLRLRFRLERERERRRYLVAAATLPAGSRVADHRSDGNRFTVDVGSAEPDVPR